MKIIVSSSNKDKLAEIQAILGNEYELVTKADAGYDDIEVEENGDTLEANALLKARAIHELSKANVLADDTGLFVEYLDGKPGVYAARYAGEGCSYQDNVDKMLEELKQVDDITRRKAYFETAICYITEDGKEHFTKGRMYGHIGFEQKGTHGFGYDPIFIPEGFNVCLAEMTDDEKNKISHRANAIANFKEMLRNL
ncbi:MAG: RdgB/HAM1 family non-canonical purine NTP pyrophosphatase [Tissierellia bacterium]|nr:RdgB/HAM1 family non-canonical purine NTP pyrophosphatase [Tissierellia bacterium]